MQERLLRRPRVATATLGVGARRRHHGMRWRAATEPCRARGWGAGRRARSSRPLRSPTTAPDVAASADGRVYVPVRTGKLVIVDPKTATISASVEIEGQPYAVAVTPGGRRAYVVDFLGQYVTVVTTADASVKTTIPIGTIQRPSLRPSAAASRDGRRV